MSHCPTEPLPPYKRVPSSWVCASCGERATGFSRAHGDHRFFCDAHQDLVEYDLFDRHGIAGGYTCLRHSWSYWLASFWWRCWSFVVWRKRRWINKETWVHVDETLGSRDCDWCNRHVHLDIDGTRQAKTSWNGKMDEESIAPFRPFLERQAALAKALEEEQGPRPD